MLIFFLLCVFVQTLWGKPLPPLAPSPGLAANLNVTSVQQCPAASADDGQKLRSVYDIVQSCFFTIFACVWTSIHPNINGPRDSWWTCMKRRVVTTVCAVIAPELILWWALNQRSSGKYIAEDYNSDFETLKETKTSIWTKFRQLFKRLPKSTTRRGTRQPWTITHGFFVQMGGFILYEDEYPKEVLTKYRLGELIRQGAIDAPTVTERELQDRSKGDTISKGIVVLQTTWFVLQCIVRTAQHLPLSELEVLTLAFAVMNAAIYVAWWNKPQGVDTAISIPLKKAHNGSENSDSAPTRPDPAMQSDEDTDEEDTWIQRKLREDRERYSSSVFLLVRVPYRVSLWLMHPLLKLSTGHGSKALQPQFAPNSRLSMFHMEGFGSVGLTASVACATGMIFGGIHLLGWTLEFPLPSDRILWQISAVILTVAPSAPLLGVFTDSRKYDHSVFKVLLSVSEKLTFTLAPLYIIARFVVIAIAFKTILHPSHNVLLDISWTRYIPHF